MENGAAWAAPSSCITVAARSSHPIHQVAEHFRHALRRVACLLHHRGRDALGAGDRGLLPRALATSRALAATRALARRRLPG